MNYLTSLLHHKFAILLTLLLATFIFAQPVKAFSTPEDTYYPWLFDQAVFKTDEMNLQSFVYEVYKAVQASTKAFGVGCTTCATTKARINDVAAFGAAGELAYGINAIYDTKPASSIDYIADIGAHLGIVKNTYADDTGLPGLGFSKFQILLPIWKAFRDLSYILFALIFIFTGFAVMFKMKIDPRTVVTIESALPKIIVSLILVTFSYAIAGFLVDIMWVVNNLLITIFHGIMTSTGAGTLTNWFAGRMSTTPSTSEFGFFTTIIGLGTPPVIISVVILGLITAIGAAIPNGVSFIAGIFLLLLIITFIIALVKLFMTLLKAYINVLIAIVTAPMQFTLGALPGVSTTSSWFKNIFGNLAVMPVVLFMTFLAGYLTLASIDNLHMTHGITTYLTGTGDPTSSIQEMRDVVSQPGLKDQVQMIFIMIFAGIGLLLMAPKAADMIQGYINGKPISAGMALGEATALMAGVGGMAAGNAVGGAAQNFVNRASPYNKDPKTNLRVGGHALPTSMFGQQISENTYKGIGETITSNLFGVKKKR